MNLFGPANPKPEGMLYISEERLEDNIPLPKLPPKIVCKGVILAGKKYSLKEYTKEFIKQQSYF